MNRVTCLLAAALAIAGCQGAVPPSALPSVDGPSTGLGSSGVVMSATGGGHYRLTVLGVDAQFSLSAVQRADGRASGQFHHKFVFDGLLIDFHGEVTCMAVDSVNHRAWIGGIVKHNKSEHPDFQQAIHGEGRDLWFRILDNGEGADAPPDRTTFVGFEGAAGIRTSAEYCQRQIWPADPPNAITGNVTVRP